MDNLVIEEKMKNLNLKQDEIIDKLDKLTDDVQSALQRIAIIETKNGNKIEVLSDAYHATNLRIAKLEADSSSMFLIASKIADSAIKFLLAIGIAFLLYKTGWNK